MYLKQFIDEPEQWEQVTEQELKQELSGYYIDTSLCIEAMKSRPNEPIIRTPFALYKYQK